MNLSQNLIIIIGLVLFETISSIDNAVVNADVLATMSERWRKWFLFYGIIFAVFVVRGLLPFGIVHSTGVLAGEEGAHMLLAGGGIFLIFLFFHWLFLETKKYAFFIERHIHHKLSFWFYAVVSVILLAVVWGSVRETPLVALGAVVGSSAFFIVNGFKRNAEEMEKKLSTSHMSSISKILYLELIDTSFSIDGVLGAFAFTISVPLILIGNGLGALIVRYFTVHGVATVKKYAYLKNGAMYSIGFLGLIMLMESQGSHVQSWVSPVITFLVVGLFLYLSKKELEVEKVI